MRSLQQLRRLIGPADGLSDEQLSELRDQLYELARAAVAVYGDPRPKSLLAVTRPTRRFLRLVPPHRLEEAEERAAIREFDGGQDRADAERATLTDLGLTGAE